jgi:hypothetical protein
MNTNGRRHMDGPALKNEVKQIERSRASYKLLWNLGCNFDGVGGRPRINDGQKLVWERRRPRRASESSTRVLPKTIGPAIRLTNGNMMSPQPIMAFWRRAARPRKFFVCG